MTLRLSLLDITFFCRTSRVNLLCCEWDILSKRHQRSMLRYVPSNRTSVNFGSMLLQEPFPWYSHRTGICRSVVALDSCLSAPTFQDHGTFYKSHDLASHLSQTVCGKENVRSLPLTHCKTDLVVQTDFEMQSTTDGNLTPSDSGYLWFPNLTWIKILEWPVWIIFCLINWHDYLLVCEIPRCCIERSTFFPLRLWYCFGRSQLVLLPPMHSR